MYGSKPDKPAPAAEYWIAEVTTSTGIELRAFADQKAEARAYAIKVRKMAMVCLVWDMNSGHALKVT